ncbi:MAG: outer membrane protein assembly factor BamB [Gammaproteobacteria bacterium]
MMLTTLARAMTLVALAGVMTSGCGTLSNLISREDNTLSPAPLPRLENARPIKTLWNRDAGAGVGKQHIMLTPATDGERIFVSDHKGQVQALSAKTGKTLWKTRTRAPISAGIGLGDGHALVGGLDGQVLALSVEDGTLAWQAAVSSEVLSVPSAADGKTIVRTVDGKLFALDSLTGAQLWVYERPVPALTLRGTSSPLVVANAAIVGLDSGRLAAISLTDGQPIWETPISVPRGRSELERMVDLDAQPIVVDDILYVASFQGAVAAVDRFSGDLLWRRDLSSYAGLGADGQRLYVTDERSHIWAFDRHSHASVWRQDALQGRRLTAPVSFLDYVVVGDFEGYVHWLQRTDGKLVARTRVDRKGITAPPLLGIDTLYVYGQGGKLAALQMGG